MALVELYGRGVEAVLREVFRPARGQLPLLGRACLGDLVAGAESFDEAVLTRIASTDAWSFLETWSLAFHGGTWLQARVVELLSAYGGQRLDTRGVLRLAVHEERMDAIRAAAYELLLASTAQRAAGFFLRQYSSGELSNEVGEILGALAAGAPEAARTRLVSLLEWAEPAVRLGTPLRVLLAGRPNVGKSTLFNALLEDERAVVASVAGTTRDLIEEDITLDDYPFRLIDSAGLRPHAAVDPVEREGVARARAAVAAGRCDRVLYLIAPPWRLESVDKEFLASVGENRALLVYSKADVAPEAAPEVAASSGFAVSAHSGGGLATLRAGLLERWLGLAPQQEVPCGPFTEPLRGRFERALEELSGGQRELDGVRRLFIECLRMPWLEPS